METKKCKYCQSDIPIKAKVCPQCRRKQGGKLKWVIIVFIVLVLLGQIFKTGNDKGIEKAKKATDEANERAEYAEEVANELSEEGEDTKEDTEEISNEIGYTPYSVTELEDDLDNNALAASDKYKDQYVELTGRLGTIDSDGKYISLMDPNDEWDFLGVQCYIKNDAQLDVVKTLAKDSMVIVKGKITSVGEVLGYSLDMDDIYAQ